MENTILKQDSPEIESRIFTLRNKQVMIDMHLAELYNVEVKVLNQAVKRNPDRFPDTFFFQLSETEWGSLRSQFVTLETTGKIRPGFQSNTGNRGRHRKYLPYAFTEQGVAMLSAVLRSETAVKVSIRIMNAFIEMRKFIQANTDLFHRMDMLESKQTETDRKFSQVFQALEKHEPKPENGIFFDGQIFDAYVFVSDLIRSARHSIILIDNYIDESVLLLLTKRKKGVKAIIYTRNTKIIMLDIEKHNQQYNPVEFRKLESSHDRFLLIDEVELYHIGASLKDLGKKWFAFSRLNSMQKELLEKLGINKMINED
jgi:hypothetical protein